MNQMSEQEVEERIVPQPEPEAEPRSLGELADRIMSRLAKEGRTMQIELDEEIAQRLREREAEEGETMSAEEIALQGVSVWSQLRSAERATIGFAVIQLVKNRLHQQT